MIFPKTQALSMALLSVLLLACLLGGASANKLVSKLAKKKGGKATPKPHDWYAWLIE